MRNYLELTTSEAIQHFLLEYKSLFPAASEPVLQKLNKLREQKDDIYVSVSMPTHHVKPDYLKDSIVLKNLVSDTEKWLHEMLDKRFAAKVIANIKEAQESIDHSHNSDGLVLYATESFSTVVKVPVELKENIVIGQYFDLSPLYKAMLQNRRYFLLTVSRNKIRVLQAFNDTLVEEVENLDFPFINSHYFTEDWIKLAQDTFMSNQIKEYFNTADKKFQKYFNESLLPVILMGDGKGLSYYQEQMDCPKIVIGEVHGSFDDTPVHEILNEVNPVIEQYREQRQAEYIKQMDDAQSANLLAVDPRDIRRMVAMGNADILYLGNRYSLHGEINGDEMDIFTDPERYTPANDLLPQLIDEAQNQGARIFFVHDEILEPLGGIALIRRY